MATLPRSLQLIARQDIINQRLTPAQVQEAELTAVTRWLVSRLSNPEGRPRTLEKPSVELILAAHKQMLRRSAIAPDGSCAFGPYFAAGLPAARRSVPPRWPTRISILQRLQPTRTPRRTRLVFLSDDQNESSARHPALARSVGQHRSERHCCRICCGPERLARACRTRSDSQSAWS
jgi:hypothetical protein